MERRTSSFARWGKDGPARRRPNERRPVRDAPSDARRLSRTATYPSENRARDCYFRRVLSGNRRKARPRRREKATTWVVRFLASWHEAHRVGRRRDGDSTPRDRPVADQLLESC